MLEHEIQWSIRIWENYASNERLKEVIPEWVYILDDRYHAKDGKWRGE